MNSSSYITNIVSAIRAHLPDTELPSQGQNILLYIYAVLVLTRGITVSNEDVHNAWAAWAAQYEPENPSIVPYNQLSASEQDKDLQFTTILQEVARSLR